MEKAILVVVAVSMVVAALAPLQSEAAMSCSTVASDLSPCINYVVYGGGGGMPPMSCCQGIKSLYNAASNTADRQTACSCLKSVASSASPAIVANAASLPAKCGVNIPYKISPSTDCSSVH